MVGAGWYDDPLVPGGKRWWTGQAWTDETRPPPSGGGWAAGAIPAEPAPWVPGGAPRAAPAGPDGPPRPLGPIADWIGQAFGVLVRLAAPLVALYAVLPAALVAGGYVAIRTGLADVVVFADDGRVEGLGAASAVLAVVVWLGVGIGLTGVTLGGLHFLTTVHRDRADRPPADPLQSLGVGLGRIPRLIGVGLIVAIGVAVAVVGIAAMVAVTFSTFGDGAGLAVIVGLVVAGVPFLIWLMVKLVFLQVAVVAVPLGSSALAGSWRLSTGRFWPVLLRVVLWVAVTAAIAVPVQLVNQFVVLPSIESGFGLGDSGELLIGGRPFDEIESVRLGDVLPPVPGALPWMVVAVALNGVVQAVSGSLLTALFADAERRRRPR